MAVLFDLIGRFDALVSGMSCGLYGIQMVSIQNGKVLLDTEGNLFLEMAFKIMYFSSDTKRLLAGELCSPDKTVPPSSGTVQ